MNPSNSQRAPTPGAFSDVPQQGSRRGTPLPFHQTSASAPLYPVDPGTPVSSLALSRAGTPLPPLRSPAPSTPQPTVSPIPSGSHPPPVPAALNAPPQHISNPQAPAFVYGDNRLGSEALPDGGDLSNPDAWPSVAELIARLLDPPRQAFDYYHGKKGAICIKLSWVVKTIGEPHFMNNPAVSRSVLRPDSKLRIWGRARGLPEGYYLWLCGPAAGEGPRDGGWFDRTEYWMPEEHFHLVPEGQRKN